MQIVCRREGPPSRKNRGKGGATPYWEFWGKDGPTPPPPGSPSAFSNAALCLSSWRSRLYFTINVAENNKVGCIRRGKRMEEWTTSNKIRRRNTARLLHIFLLRGSPSHRTRSSIFKVATRVKECRAAACRDILCLGARYCA